MIITPRDFDPCSTIEYQKTGLLLEVMIIKTSNLTIPPSLDGMIAKTSNLTKPPSLDGMQ